MATGLSCVGRNPSTDSQRSPRLGPRCSGPGFAEAFEPTGDPLKRPSKEFDPDHPNIEDLKHRDHVATVPFSEEEATAEGFIESFADACRMASPYAKFLTTAVGASRTHPTGFRSQAKELRERAQSLLRLIGATRVR